MKQKILFFLMIAMLTGSHLFMISCGGGGETNGGLVVSSADSPPPSGTGSVTLQWEAPTTNTDGSQLTDLSGYKVYYGASSQSYTASLDTGNSTGAVISSLSPGTWCFAATAYDMDGNESDYSNEVCTTI